MKTRVAVVLIAAVFTSLAMAQRTSDQSLDRTFTLNHVDTMPNLQEISTIVHAIGDIRPAAPETQQKSITIHGTSDQIALAEWLVPYLDISNIPTNDSNSGQQPKYRIPVTKDDATVVSVFYLPHTQTVQDLQEAATVVRSIADLRRLFIYTARKAMVVRGTPEQVDLAEWLLKQFDQPASNAVKREYAVPGPGFPDNIVRVVSLHPGVTPPRLQEIALQVRTTTQVRRLFTYTTPRIITLRGTPSQVEQANQLIMELDR